MRKTKHVYTETRTRQIIDALAMYVANNQNLTEEDEENASSLVLELLKFRDKMEENMQNPKARHA